MVTSAGCVVGGGGDSGDMISLAGAGVGVVAAEGKVARVAVSSTIIGFFFVLEVEFPIGTLSYDEGGYGVVNKPRGLTREMMDVVSPTQCLFRNLVHGDRCTCTARWRGKERQRAEEFSEPASEGQKMRRTRPDLQQIL